MAVEVLADSALEVESGQQQVEPPIKDLPSDYEPRYCACGCGQEIPAYYHPNSKYISGHKNKAQKGELGTLGTGSPPASKGSPALSKRARRAPQFGKLFRRIDAVLHKSLGTDEGLWDLDRDEVRDLEEAWTELIATSEESMLITRGLNVAATVGLVLSVAMIFAPRIFQTVDKYLQSIKEVQRDDRRRSNTGSVARADSQASDSGGESGASVSRPWDNDSWDTPSATVSASAFSQQ